jgi:NAD(P)-dependent dehydrogenase (short-subunit alcohol dehydrogenase family)
MMAAMEIRGRHAVVTGGASGIGRALCRRFAKEGARAVVVADLDRGGAEAVAREVGGRAVVADVGSEADVRRLLATAEQEHGPVDLFCGNAGIGVRGGVEASDADWQRIWQINVMQHVYAARALLPGMLGRGEGYFLITASAAGLLTQIGSAPYAVTKHAAVSIAEWLSVTYGDAGIRVSCLCPQAVRTGMTAGGPGVAGLDGMLEPEQVADAVLDAMRAERFLVLPHPQVAEYVRRKAADHDRWIRGMRRLQARFGGTA